MMENKINEILRFWFDGDFDTLEKMKQRMTVWFSASEEFDREVTELFADDVERAAAGEYDHFTETPRGTLALILLLDQFPRNIHRGTKHAFANDAKALAHCLRLSDSKQDAEMSLAERMFVLMPLQHAEDKKIQQLSVERFAQLSDGMEGPWLIVARGTHEFALIHKKIIDRFGRFPHRNKLLGRESTPEEEAYLQDTEEDFGQA